MDVSSTDSPSARLTSADVCPYRPASTEIRILQGFLTVSVWTRPPKSTSTDNRNMGWNMGRRVV